MTTRWHSLRYIFYAMPLAALAVLLAAPMAYAAPAHASYVRSNPAANAVVKTAPSVVTITFAEPVTPGGSGVVIYDAKNRVVSQPAQVDPSDLATLRVPMAGDDSEIYLVVWHTVSAQDGDPDVGAFSFFVNSSGVSDLSPKTGAGALTPVSQNSSGAPIWLVIIVGLVGVAVGLGGGVALARRGAMAGATADTVEQER
jgi:copper resistance protein C